MHKTHREQICINNNRIVKFLFKKIEFFTYYMFINIKQNQIKDQNSKRQGEI